MSADQSSIERCFTTVVVEFWPHATSDEISEVNGVLHEAVQRLYCPEDPSVPEPCIRSISFEGSVTSDPQGVVLVDAGSQRG